jgi:hypothetical protein
LSPVSSKSIHGQLLIGVGFIVAIKSTLGATIQTASRLFLGGAISSVYCLVIVNFFHSDIYIGVGATNIFVLLIVYTDLPITVRRFSIVPTCIILLQWFSKPLVNTQYVLQIWAALTIGGALAIVMSCIPLPVVPTAHRELVMRMRFIARQVRREITAIVLLISEYHNVHLSDSCNYTNQRSKTTNSIAEDEPIEMPCNAYREDDLYNHSTSFENLRDDHLLKSDIQDLHALVNDELTQMRRALTEITFEPYFLLIQLSNAIRIVLRTMPCLKRFVRCPSTLEARLDIWTTCFASLQRTITGMLSLDHHHHAFVGQRQLINVSSCSLFIVRKHLNDEETCCCSRPSVFFLTRHLIFSMRLYRTRSRRLVRSIRRRLFHVEPSSKKL